MKKTADQVREYLFNVDWKHSYMDELCKYQNNVRTATAIMNGIAGEQTIMASFLFNHTAEGRDVWVERDGEFRKWYNE